ncbi:hypothetical protein TNCV_2770741 [Trichonephila clavipes]|nr:hypothetical protein TNCV_2770741 [Trichonephila clavipes]
MEIGSSYSHYTDSPLLITHDKSLNSCRGVIAEPDLLAPPKTEILEGFSNQGVIQVTKSSTLNNFTQTDENITKVKCPTLKLLQPLSSLPKTNTSISTLVVSKLSSSTQAHLLSSISSIAATVSEPQPSTLVSDAMLSTTNNMCIPIEPYSPTISASPSNFNVQVPKSAKQNSKHKEIAQNCQVIYSQFGLAIHQNDHQARRRFVEWAQNEIGVVRDFHKRILFSDEAHFWLNGYVNKQNCRIWSEANPQVYVETPLHPEKLTVWCTLWAGGILLQKR